MPPKPLTKEADGKHHVSGLDLTGAGTVRRVAAAEKQRLENSKKLLDQKRHGDNNGDDEQNIDNEDSAQNIALVNTSLRSSNTEYYYDSLESVVEKFIFAKSTTLDDNVDDDAHHQSFQQLLATISRDMTSICRNLKIPLIMIDSADDTKQKQQQQYPLGQLLAAFFESEAAHQVELGQNENALHNFLRLVIKPPFFYFNTSEMYHELKNEIHKQGRQDLLFMDDEDYFDCQEDNTCSSSDVGDLLKEMESIVRTHLIDQSNTQQFFSRVSENFSDICQGMKINQEVITLATTASAELQQEFPVGVLFLAFFENVFTDFGKNASHVLLSTMLDVAVGKLGSFFNDIDGMLLELEAKYDEKKKRKSKNKTILEYKQKSSNSRALIGFKKVLASAASEESIHRRHVSSDAFAGISLVENTELLYHCQNGWNYSPSKALVIGGSSGSGKTVAALQAASGRHRRHHHDQPQQQQQQQQQQQRRTPQNYTLNEDVVIYLTPKDIVPPSCSESVAQNQNREEKKENCANIDDDDLCPWQTSTARTELLNQHQNYVSQTVARGKKKSNDETQNVNDETAGDVALSDNDDIGERDKDDTIDKEARELKQSRNFIVVHAIESTISAFFPHLAADKKWIGYRVIIIFDEIGGDRILVRALRSAIRTIALKLHEKFFGTLLATDDPQFDEKCRVNFILSGTGLAVPGSGSSGSESDTAFCYQLDIKNPLDLNTESMRHFVRPDKMDSPEVRHLHRLHALMSANKRELVSSTQLLVLDLCKNARCAALFFVRLNLWLSGYDANNNFQIHASGFSDAVLSSFLPEVVRGYVNRNGLQHFLNPENVLLCALAVVTFKVPLLPLASSSSTLLNWLRHRTNNRRFRNASLHDLLSVTGGILVDHLFSDENVDNLFSDENIKNNDDNNNKNKNNDEVVNGQSRYSFYDAHLAMIHIMFGIERKPPGWSGFETSTSDFCLLVARVSPFFSEIKCALFQEYFGYDGARQKSVLQCLEDSCVAEKLVVTQKKNSKVAKATATPLTSFAKRQFLQWREVIEEDSLYKLKEALVFDSCTSKEKRSDERLHVHQYLNRVQLVIAAENNFDKHFKKILEGINSTRSNTDNHNSVFVMLSAEKEQFADVVVVGPGKIVLVQCKGCADVSTVKGVQSKINEELVKMGAGRAPASITRYLNQLENIAAEEAGIKKNQVEVHYSLLFALGSEALIPEAVQVIQQFTKKGGVKASGGYMVTTDEQNNTCNFFPSYSFQYISSEPHHPVKSTF